MIEILTAILVIITSLYVYFTYKILKANETAVKAMEQQNISLSRPYISFEVYISMDAHYYLQIKNVGKSSAENLKLSINKDYFSFARQRDDENIRNRYEFNNIIKSFPPKNVINLDLAHGSQLFSKKYNKSLTPLNFVLTAEYEFANQKVSEKTNIDLRQYEKTILLRDPINDELFRIRKELTDIKNKLIVK